MILRLTTTFACLLLFTSGLFSQTPENIRLSPKVINSAIETVACDFQNAGTVASIMPVGTPQSNDIGLSRTFLCLGDQVRIDHANDFDLSDLGTAAPVAGIAYAFLDCNPNATGPSLNMILADPCINTQSPILLNGNITNQTEGIWIAAEMQNGDANFINDGNLLTAFTGGREAKEFWFAPITVDSFAKRTYYIDPATDEPGPCVNMRADAAFPVVYLAPIESTNPSIGQTGGDCTGAFEVRGGFPEFDRTGSYSITIENTRTASVGTITSGNAAHGSTVEFSVPEFGIYEVTVEDGKSCSSTFRMNFARCNGVASNATSDIVAPGDIVCVDVEVNDFTDIATLQYTIQWDQTVLELTSIEPGTPPAPGLNIAGDFGDFRNDGQMTMIWTSPDVVNGTTLTDGFVFYRLCFRAIGTVGESTDILLNGSKTNVEASNSSQVKIGFDNSTVGKISISTLPIDLQYRYDTACHLAPDGAFEVFPIGGTAPYQVSYRKLGDPNFLGPFPINNPSGSHQTNFNIEGGAMYEIQVTDNSVPSETLLDTITMAQRPELAVNIDPVQEISCPGDMDGVLIANVFISGVQVMNPGSDFQYSWLPSGEQTRVISNLPSQNYLVTVTDANGCEAITSRRLETPELISITGSTTTASCSGIDDGGIQFDVLLGGMTPPPGTTYDITMTGPNSAPITQNGTRLNISTGLIAGRYDINISDTNGCSVDTFLVIDALKTLSLLQPIIVNVQCDGNSDGQIFIEGTTTGAPAATPYTFTWLASPPVPAGNTINTDETSTISMLSVGNYRVQMADTDGCELDTTFMITAPDSIRIILVDKTNETCTGLGDIEVRVTGGTAVSGYTFDWGIPGQTTNIATGLQAGNYTLNVTDDNQCGGTFDFNISGPSLPVITSFRNDTLDCNGDNNGILTADAIPGSAPIATYSWFRGPTGTTIMSGATVTSISNLDEGEYYVEVESTDGCIVRDTAYVIAPAPLVIDSIVTNSPGCINGNDGFAIAYVSGGNMPYQYFWSTSPASPGPPIVENLIASSIPYNVRIEDANGCPDVMGSFNIDNPPYIVIDVIDSSPVSCFGATGAGCDGSVTVIASYSDGSAGNFSFTWYNGESDMNTTTSTATMLCAGDARGLSVSDGFCTLDTIVVVESNAPLSANVEATPVSCFGRADGTATIEMSGGQLPFTYDWIDAPINSMDDMVGSLPADTFTVEIQDFNGCQFSTSVIITEPDEFMVDVDIFQDATKDVKCPGGDDGQITVTTFGGNPGNLSYQWDPAVGTSSSPVASDLSAGTYSVTVTDASGCEASTMHTIIAPPPITFSLDSVPPVQCFGFTTSINIANVSGGNGASYAYAVDGAPEQDISFTTNVFSGAHVITVFDSKDCELDTNIIITQPNPVAINIDPVIEVELGDSIQLRPQYNPGGVPINGDSIFWEPAEFLSCDRCSDPFVRPLTDQIYTITAYDQNGCPGFAEVLIEVDRNRNVFVPNAFSPNGDGVNDEFRVFTGVGVSKVNYINIFDRWGNILYADTDIEPNISGIPTWDGFYKGKPMDSGVFVYLVEVEFEDGLKLLYRGDLTLLR